MFASDTMVAVKCHDGSCKVYTIGRGKDEWLAVEGIKGAEYGLVQSALYRAFGVLDRANGLLRLMECKTGYASNKATVTLPPVYARGFVCFDDQYVYAHPQDDLGPTYRIQRGEDLKLHPRISTPGGAEGAAAALLHVETPDTGGLKAIGSMDGEGTFAVPPELQVSARRFRVSGGRASGGRASSVHGAPPAAVSGRRRFSVVVDGVEVLRYPTVGTDVVLRFSGVPLPVGRDQVDVTGALGVYRAATQQAFDELVREHRNLLPIEFGIREWAKHARQRRLAEGGLMQALPAPGGRRPIHPRLPRQEAVRALLPPAAVMLMTSRADGAYSHFEQERRFLDALRPDQKSNDTLVGVTVVWCDEVRQPELLWRTALLLPRWGEDSEELRRLTTPTGSLPPEFERVTATNCSIREWLDQVLPPDHQKKDEIAGHFYAARCRTLGDLADWAPPPSEWELDTDLKQIDAGDRETLQIALASAVLFSGEKSIKEWLETFLAKEEAEANTEMLGHCGKKQSMEYVGEMDEKMNKSELQLVGIYLRGLETFEDWKAPPLQKMTAGVRIEIKRVLAVPPVAAKQDSVLREALRTFVDNYVRGNGAYDTDVGYGLDLEVGRGPAAGHVRVRPLGAPRGAAGRYCGRLRRAERGFVDDQDHGAVEEPTGRCSSCTMPPWSVRAPSGGGAVRHARRALRGGAR